jgi:NADH-ubiquinone oxidoreductase chain 5
MLISVVILPLISTVLVGVFGRILGKIGAMLVSNFFIFLTLIIAMVSWYEISLSGCKLLIELWPWFSIGFVEVKWTFFFDSLTCTMLIVITSISMLVHIYSTSYMEEDPHIIRFMCYLSLFTFFMIILVTSFNFIQLFLGWEGVGISSYLLINFWFTRTAANQSAIKAIIVNRFGDVGLLIGILGIFNLVKSVDFSIIFTQLGNLEKEYFLINTIEMHALTLISIALFIGAVGKSAQMGLHTWLPDAMEGPTPVSALIHAATMVTAGVFVLIRLSPILEYSSYALTIVTVIGGLTGFFAGTVGIFQNDLKRVIAYSTCSQLGYMVAGCGLSSYSVALFHLMNHAFFKALLFLSAGAVIHAVLDEQDMRRMGGLLHILPFTFSMFIIGSLSLMGFPYTTGYYSKDVLLELAISSYYVYSVYIYWLLFLGAGCTAFYSFRLLYIVFLGESNLSKKTFNFVHDAPLRMAGVMVILSFGSIFIGYICKDMFLGLGSTFFGNSLGYSNKENNYQLIEAEFLMSLIKVLPIIFSITCASIAYFSYKYYYNFFYIKTNSQVKIYTFFNKKWYFDLIYNKIIIKLLMNFGYYISHRLLDKGIMEILGPVGLIRIFASNERFFLQHNSGYIFKGVFIIIISLISYIWFSKNLQLYFIVNEIGSILFIYCAIYFQNEGFVGKKKII